MASPKARKYRSAKALPYELSQHCRIYFEEKLYNQGLNLLLSLLSSGTVSSSPAFIPSPQHLALAATFLIHPSTTTRAKSEEIEQASNLALQLLQQTNSLVGPLAANFDAAFTFTHFTKSRGGLKRHHGDPNNPTEPTADIDTEALRFDLAESGSLWSRAEDFWHAVGWAFNCSVLHPKRWRRWKLWLQFMCEALEDDWAERERQVAESKITSPSKSRVNLQPLKESLIVKYITAASGVSGQHRRILRAIFADGSSTAANEFREVFQNELKELEKDKDKPKKREADVNIEEEEYGDYLITSDEEGDEVSSPHGERPKRAKRSRTTLTRGLNANEDLQIDPSYRSSEVLSSDQTTYLGDLSSLYLRQRLLQLLSRVSHALGKVFMPLGDLYHLFVDFIRHLPLPTFQLLVSSPVISGFASEAQTTLGEILLYALLTSDIPESDDAYLNQDKLERCYLPYATNNTSAVDNAKVSIVLESLVRNLASGGLLHARPSLKQALEKGIMARAEAADTDTKKGQIKQKAEEMGWLWLIESGERLTYMVEKLYPQEEN